METTKEEWGRPVLAEVMPRGFGVEADEGGAVCGIWLEDAGVRTFFRWA